MDQADARQARCRLYLLAFWGLLLAAHQNLIAHWGSGDDLQALLILAAGVSAATALLLGRSDEDTQGRITTRHHEEAAEPASLRLLRVQLERNRHPGRPLAIIVVEVRPARGARELDAAGQEAVTAAEELLRRYADPRDEVLRLSANRVASVMTGSVGRHEVERILDRLNEDIRNRTRATRSGNELHLGAVVDAHGRASVDSLCDNLKAALEDARTSGRRIVTSDS